MPRLLLVNVVDRRIPGFSSYRISRIPPLGLAYLAAVTPPGWDVRLLDENFETFDPADEADLVGLSAMTPDVTRAYRIAGRLRGRGTPVVMGGVHVSMRPREALDYADSVVIGEAEAVWPRLLDDAARGALAPTYRGTWGSLSGLPLPRRDLFPPAYRTATLQTARGCPFGCEFCSVSRFNGGRYRTRPVGEVLDELETIPQRALFFVDDNLFGTARGGRQRALELFEGMIERGIHKYWLGQASLEMAKDEPLLEQAARSGCKLLLIGFESTQAESLRGMGKRVNLRADPRNYRDLIACIHRHGISVWGAFIVGNDEETPASLRRTTRFLARSGLDVLQLTAMTPLPGTPLYDRLLAEGRIRYTCYPEDWRRYSFMECVIRPRRLTKADVDRALFRLRKRYWGSRVRIFLRFLHTLASTRSLTTALAAHKMNRSWATIFRGLYGGRGKGGPLSPPRPPDPSLRATAPRTS